MSATPFFDVRRTRATQSGPDHRARARSAVLTLPLQTIRQTDEGTVLVGDSQQDRDFDDSCGVDVLAAMAARAVRVFPALGGARVVRAWAALRVMTPDSFPVYEQSAAHPGAFVATCHSGVTLAAAHAYAFAPAVAAGMLPQSLRPFAATRFGAVRREQPPLAARAGG